MSKRVSVIIPVYRDWERLALCLDALARQTLPADDFEIIVVNNEPEPARPCGKLPANARIIDEPRPGSYAARNAAVALASGAILAFVDSDCVPDHDWLERGLEALAANPEARAVGPVPIFREPGGGYFAYVYDFHTAFRFKEAAAHGRCGAGNLFVARAVFDRVGPFDARLASGGDTEWSGRAHRMGVPIVFDERICVRHPARRTIGAIMRKTRRIAGSEAVRTNALTHRYVLSRLIPPVKSYRRLLARKRGPISLTDRIVLYLIHWLGRILAGLEFLVVRAGLKAPNRT